MNPERVIFEADVAIVGGGTAGCLTAITLKEQVPQAKVIILEKADIRRSGCLAAGANSINTYLHGNATPESYLKYLREETMGLLQEDLVLSAAERINEVVERVEGWGLSIPKDLSGVYIPGSRWQIKINGERIKPLLARKVQEQGVKVLNRVAATGFLLSGSRVIGVTGIGVRDGRFYIIKAGTVVCATGGAAGLYQTNQVGRWYPPFNTGAGYAMGIRAGAEMTSFEMRFIGLSVKGVKCPVNILVQDFGASLVNSLGERYMEKKFTHTGGECSPACIQLYGFLQEVREGRGPCYVDTQLFTSRQLKNLKEFCLDMYPETVLYWSANNIDLRKELIEICGTEPFITGGHSLAGYWVNINRRTTLPGLYACGDVAGGYPYKFISGSWVEGVIVGETIANELSPIVKDKEIIENIFIEEERAFAPIKRYQQNLPGINPYEMEMRLQKIMDEYAGGISCFYELSENRLIKSRNYLSRMEELIPYLKAKDSHQLMKVHEVIDRIEVAKVTVEHLLYRKETRYFQFRTDYPEKNDFNWLKFVNSRRNHSGEIKMLERPLRG